MSPSLLEHLEEIKRRLLGSLVTFDLAIRLRTDLETLGEGTIVIPGDVGIIIDIAAHRPWGRPQFHVAIWYRVLMTNGDGWFNPDATDWRTV